MNANFSDPLPSNIEAEQAILGALLINNDALSAIPPTFHADHFYERLHQQIFDAVLRGRAVGKSMNPVTVRSFMAPEAATAKVGDMTVAQYLARLVSEAVSVNGVADFADAITGYYHRREAMSIGDDAHLAGIKAEDELEFIDRIKECRDKLTAIVSSIESRNGPTTAPGDHYLSMFEASARRDGVIGVPIALPEVARVLSEPVFEAGNLYGLLSSSGEGKSSLTMQLIYHAVNEGHPVLFLSYDQSASQCVRQMIAQVHEISVRQQREPSRLMTDYERDQCVMFATRINQQPFDIIRCQREGVDRLVGYARRFIKKRANGKTPFIVIDHIGKVKPRDPKLSADRISGEVTVELKALADETQASVLILNQRNSFGTRRDNPRPIAADLYGGEGAKADYDAILYLYRAEKYKAERVATAATSSDWNKINSVFVGDLEGIAEVGSVKCRFGDPTLKETLEFEAEFTRYRSMKPTRSQSEMF